VATAAPAAPTGTRNKAEIICFRCKQKGHKSPECPTRPKGNRRVQVPDRTPLCLENEELFGYIGKCGMGVMIDTGAQVSIVFIECVEPDQLVGKKQTVKTFEGTPIQGEACEVQFVLGGRTFNRDAVAIAGELLHWTPCFRVPLTPRSDLDFLMYLAEEKGQGEQLYVPPKIHKGRLLSGYLVSGDGVGTQTLSVDTPTEGAGRTVKITEGDETALESEWESLRAIDLGDNVVNDKVNEKEDGQVEEAERMKEASVSVEGDGEFLGGCAGQESDVLVGGIKGTRSKLIEETERDETLQVARELGKREA